MVPQVAGVFTIREDQYEKALTLMSDGANLPRTYSIYKKKLESVVKLAERKGIRTMKIEVDLEEFRIWAANAGRDCDERARVAFASDAAAVRIRDGI